MLHRNTSVLHSSSVPTFAAAAWSRRRAASIVVAASQPTARRTSSTRICSTGTTAAPTAGPTTSVQSTDWGSGGGRAIISLGEPERGSGEKLRRQVFISHTGHDPDACTFAASILKPALQAVGLPVWMDFTNVKPGQELDPQLDTAASCSKVVVAVLSRSYTERFYCMRELHLACESRAARTGVVVIPVFYDDRSNLQPQTVQSRWGKTGDLYQKQSQKRQVVILADRWAEIITDVEELPGVKRQLKGGRKDNDRQLAAAVAAACLPYLPPELPLDYTVGYEQQLRTIASELGGTVKANVEAAGLQSAQGSSRLVWLYGCGGLGKTVMAKLIYNNLITQHKLPQCRDFENHAILEIPMDATASGTDAMLRGVLEQFGQVPTAKPALRQQLEEYVQHNKVLYIIDNVRTGTELDKLLPGPGHWFKEGSVVIVTCHNKDLPVSCKLKEIAHLLHRHALEPLAKDAAEKLFSYYAGISSTLLEARQQKDMEAIVKACAGLPLALRVMGAVLYGHDYDKTRWQEAYAALQIGATTEVDPETNLRNVLCYSFNTLVAVEKAMFLDAATALCGIPVPVAVAVWKARYEAEPNIYDHLLNLERQCLLERTDDEYLMMHDVLKYTARGVITGAIDTNDSGVNPYKGSRVFVASTCHGDAALQETDTLVVYGADKGNNISQNISPIVVQLDADSAFRPNHDVDTQPLPQQPHGLNLSDTEVLRLGRVAAPSPIGSQLKFLDLVPGGTLPTIPRYDNLTLLLGDMTRDWSIPTSNSIAAVSEPPIVICRSSIYTSWLDQFLHQLPQVSKLILDLDTRDSKGQLASLAWLWQQTRLESLVLHHKWSMVEPGLLERLTSLRSLTFLNCNNMTACLPFGSGMDGFQVTQNLTALSFTGCSRMESIDGICGVHELPQLASLDLSGCRDLYTLPWRLTACTALSSLKLDGCEHLTELPDGLRSLPALRLTHEGCPKLRI